MSRSFDAIRDDIARMRTWMSLDRDDLGKSLCKAFTEGVQGCFAAESDPDGARWPELSEAYREAKEYQHPGQPIGVLWGVLSDPREVAGEFEAIDELAIVTYGVTDAAKEEAAWFQEGDPDRNRPARPFWGLTAEAEAEMTRILDDRFHSFR